MSENKPQYEKCYMCQLEFNEENKWNENECDDCHKPLCGDCSIDKGNFDLCKACYEQNWKPKEIEIEIKKD